MGCSHRYLPLKNGISSYSVVQHNIIPAGFLATKHASLGPYVAMETSTPSSLGSPGKLVVNGIS